MASFIRVTTLSFLAALAAAGCTVNKTEPPQPGGPSELGTSLALFASPDTITQDGRSQSEIVVQARDASSQPLRNLPLRAEIFVNGAPQDFGRLSAKTMTTGNDGRAATTYTAPGAVDSIDHQTIVSILVTPIGSDASAARPRSVSIRLVPPGVITPPTIVPPDIIADPDQPDVLQTVTFSPDFDVDGVVPENDITSYSWNFGDGGTAGTKIASHQYRKAGIYSVRLTVITATGESASRSLSLEVGAGALPVASFVFSPSEPEPGADVIFNGSASSATPPRRIVKYEWVFGNGNKASGMIATTRFTTAGTYNVTLTVTDDAGNKNTASQAVAVGLEEEEPEAP